MFQIKVVGEIKTHILCPIIFLNSIVYEKMWKNTVEPDRPHVTIWHMIIACWIPKATNTQSKYSILIAFPRKKWLHVRTLFLRFVYALPVLFSLVTHED
jgi:hypothetical protein